MQPELQRFIPISKKLDQLYFDACPTFRKKISSKNAQSSKSELLNEKIADLQTQLCMSRIEILGLDNLLYGFIRHNVQLFNSLLSHYQSLFESQITWTNEIFHESAPRLQDLDLRICQIESLKFELTPAWKAALLSYKIYRVNHIKSIFPMRPEDDFLTLALFRISTPKYGQLAKVKLIEDCGLPSKVDEILLRWNLLETTQIEILAEAISISN